MTIRSKLAWTAFLMVTVVASIGGLFLWTHDMERRYRDRMVQAVEVLTELRELSSDVERQVARVDFYLISNDPQEKDIFETLAKTNSKRIGKTQGIPWGRQYEDMLKSAASVLSGGRISRSSARGPAERFGVVAGALRQSIAAYLQSQSQLVQEQRQKTENVFETLKFSSVLIVVAGVILAVVMNAFIYRSIVYPLQYLKEQVEALGRGDSRAHVTIRGRDELATVGRAFNDMVARLKELDQMKRDFTASVTHELRSPLSASQSFLDVLVSDLEKVACGQVAPATADLERWKTFIIRVKTNMERLNRFVSDLLDVAKIERGKLECRLERVFLKPLIEETVEFFRERAKQKEIVFAAEIIADLPPCRADLDRLRQVLVNLLDNAFKFSPKGGSVAVSAHMADSRFIKISVRDSGPGIPPEHHGRLFGKFEQFKESYRYAEGARGTGLGLAISKAIIDLHGGKIWAGANAAGRGTVFYFTVPIV